MLTSERRRTILALALPIIGGMASQNVLNLVDTAMVGMLGAAALAAVGMASFINFMAVAFLTGLSAGVQAIASRRMGEGRRSETAVPLNVGLLVAMVVGLPLSLILVGFADDLFPLLINDPEVVELGVPYLRARMLAMAFVGCNFAFRGYWNGINRSRLYMRTLIAMHAVNIVLNWLLIFGHLGMPKLGCAGAGVGSAIAMVLGTFYYVSLGFRNARDAGFLRRIPDRETIASVLRLSIPAGVQQIFFAAGLTAFFWIIGRIGTAELAVSNVLVHLLLVAVLPGVGFGLAAASLVGQSLGMKKPDEAKQWGWDVSRLAMTLVGLVSIPGLVAPKLLLGLFLHEPETLEMATLPLQLLAGTMFLDTLGTVLLNAIQGAGDTQRAMMVAVSLQWGLFLPAAYLVGPMLGYGLVGVWIAQVGYRLIQTGVFATMWAKGRWATITV
ncbi:MAG: MATE family efflux transporter [bacterium]|nr:MATE family efflux transporter [bacterium]